MNFCSSENTQPQVLQTYQEVDLSAGTEESLISTATDDEIGLYDCEWGTCGIVYTNKTVFIKHVAEIHTKFTNDFCCKWRSCCRTDPFLSKHDLLLHVRMHTGERPNICHFPGCTKSYTRLENLKTHLRTHTGERPFHCKHAGCNKAFTNASDCAKHETRTHSDAKPYHCCIDGCNKAYTDPSSLRKHIKRHHGDEVYESLKKNKTPYRRRRRNVKCVSDLENNSLSVSSPVYLDQKPVLSDILNFSQSSTGSSAGSPCACRNNACDVNGSNAESFSSFYPYQQATNFYQPVFPFAATQGLLNGFGANDYTPLNSAPMSLQQQGGYCAFGSNEGLYSISRYQSQYCDPQCQNQEYEFTYY
ncbi:unnamed protein product [Enterobius vermicularis]|uniref:Zinc finger protein GLIS2 n=1 Tax=Enterobius vermicularis TaxID=51028 RepID=A0A0N4VBD8_ENTVE|nr:unnamed protein product [Enterobius vermicularis]